MVNNTYKAKIQEFPGKVSKTKFINVPKVVAVNLGLNKGDLIECVITKVNEKRVIKTYKCLVDDLVFYSDDEFPYCPICGKNDKKIIKEVFE